MSIEQLDPYLIRPAASSGTTTTEPDAIDIIIAKLNALIAVAPGGGGGQRFVYTATGAEGAEFTLTFPVAQDDTSYVVRVTGGGVGSLRLYDTVISTYTTADCTVRASSSLSAGDKLIVTVEALT